MSRRWMTRISLAAVLALAAVSCGGGDDGGNEVTLDDYSISTASSTASPGAVTFDLTNDAGQIHEFVVVKTDLAADALPLDETGDVDENGDGIEPVDEVEDIAAGALAHLTVDLAAGTYVLLCNLPGHYRQGMHASFTVS